MSAAASARPGQPFTFSLETPSLSSGTLDKYLKSVLGETSTSAIPDLLKPQGGEQPSREPTTETTKERDSEAPPPSTSENPPSEQKENAPSSPSSPPPPPPLSGHEDLESNGTVNTEAPNQTMSASQMAAQAVNSQQLATTGEAGDQMIPAPRGQNYVDITDYLNMPQAEAAKKLGIPPSTLSKRWKEAVRKRKWPYRMVCKIDKEIMTLLHNVPQGPNAPPLSEEIETALGISLRKRQEELRPVVIRI